MYINIPPATPNQGCFASSITTTWLFIKSYEMIEYASTAQKGNFLEGLECKFVLHMIMFPIRIEPRSFWQIPRKVKHESPPYNVIPILLDIPISFDLRS